MQSRLKEIASILAEDCRPLILSLKSLPESMPQKNTLNLYKKEDSPSMLLMLTGMSIELFKGVSQIKECF